MLGVWLPKTYLSQFQYTIVAWIQRESLNPTLTSEVCLPRRSPATTGRSRDSYLRLVVDGLAAKLLPLLVCTVNRDGTRFAIRRDGDPTVPDELAIFHRSDVVRPIVYLFVGGGVPSHIPFRWVGLPIEFANPNAVSRFSILVYTIHCHLDFVLLLHVSDRRALAHPLREFRLRLIEFPRAQVRVGREAGACRHKRQSQSRYCNSSFHHAAIPPEMSVGVNT